ncbi:MAG: DsbA family protein [Cognatishimia sp.]|uniref:DsbA family protein n=1 Tax=Cognatishimia sp. TaxID=2211648 RepID=UPI004058003F
MNRRTIFALAAIVAISIFVGGALLFSLTKEKTTLLAAVPNRALLIRSDAPVLGLADAPITIVEFFDPACEACRAFHPVVKEILDDFKGQVRVVLRYAAFHPSSEEAIRILEAARLQGKFGTVLERILEMQPKWASYGDLENSAWTVLLDGTGLDVERAKIDVRAPRIDRLLSQDAADLKALGVRGTPTFFVNGRPLQEFGAHHLRKLVKMEVEAL